MSDAKRIPFRDRPLGLMPSAGFSDELVMKTLFAFLSAAAVTLTITSAQAGPLVSRPAEFEKPCLEKGDANRCFELGYRFMRENGKNSKKLARYYFQKGCEAKTQRACSPAEAKYAARDFTQTNRAVASKNNSTPKLNSTSSASVAPTAPTSPAKPVNKAWRK